MNEYKANIIYFWNLGQQQVFARRSGLSCWQTISKEKKKEEGKKSSKDFFFYLSLFLRLQCMGR